MAIHSETNPRTAETAKDPLTKIKTETFCLTMDMVFFTQIYEVIDFKEYHSAFRTMSAVSIATSEPALPIEYPH